MVIDASAATAVCMTASGFALVPYPLQAPILLRSEVLAAIQGMEWRQEVSSELAELAVERLLKAPVRLARRAEVLTHARRLATSLGWAKTYDAEYVALAQISNEPLLTIDARLARRVRDIVDVRTPADL